MTKTLRNIVNGDTSRLTIVTDIRATDILLVRKFGRHSGTETPLEANWLQIAECDEKFIFPVPRKSQCPYEIFCLFSYS